MEAKITNALIRCKRTDHVPHPAFELTREDLNLWVRELPDNISDIVGDLNGIRPLLRQLRIDSLGYTLHLAATIDCHHSLVIPPALAEMAAECGFMIELITTPS